MDSLIGTVPDNWAQARLGGRNATGSAILSLNTKTLSFLPIVLPPLAVQINRR